MKSNSFKLSVGLVGFLRQETPHSCESTHALVGFPENPPKPDHKSDHKPDQRRGEWTPGHSFVATCQRYGVALRIDPDGTLVVGKAGAKADEPTQPWPSLLIAIEAHLDAVASLVEGGWNLRADFPQGEGRVKCTAAGAAETSQAWYRCAALVALRWHYGAAGSTRHACGRSRIAS
jgi:hypothetical protein